MFALGFCCWSLWHKIHGSGGCDYSSDMASRLIPALCLHREAET